MNEKKVGRSILVLFLRIFIKFWGFVSIYNLATKFFGWKHHEDIPFWFAEVYIVFWLIISFLGLSLLDPEGVVYPILVLVISYRLVDLFLGTSRIIFIERESKKDQDGHYILVRHVERWVLLIMINFVEIVVCFAVIYFYIGDSFCEPIRDAITAFYHSILTFTTLGYGEIRPCPGSSIGKIVVTAQLFYFLFFLLFTAPIIFSSVRAKEITDEKLGESDEN